MKKSKGLKINYKFILIFFIVVFKYLKMQKIISDTIVNIIFLAIIFVIVAVIVRRRILKNFNKNWLVLGIGFSLIQLLFLKDVDLLLLISVAMIFSEDKDAIKNIIKYFLISLITVFFVSILLDKMGYTQYRTISRVIDGNIRVQRNSLGFSHPNEAYVYFFFIMLAIYYFIKNRLTYTIIMGISSYFVYMLTLSRTGLICSILFIVLVWLYNDKIKLNKFAFLMGTIITFVLALRFSDASDTINQLLSQRPYLYHYYISNGNNIFNMMGSVLEKGVTLDNAFLNVILGSGWIFYLFYFMLYYVSGNIIEKDRKLSRIFVIIMIYGCIETHAMNIGLNFLLFIQMYVTITRNNKLKECEKIE